LAEAFHMTAATPWEEQVVVVTGGGSGLGAAAAAMLVGAGARVAVVDVNADAAQAVARDLGDRAMAVQADVTQEEAVRAALRAARDRFGPVRGLVHTAGVAIAERLFGRSGPHDLARFERVVSVNLVGTFNVMRLAAEVMTQNDPNAEGERGVMVVTASVAAYEGQIGQAAYAASKGGVVALVLPAARELSSYGVRVMGIAPGIFETPMMAGLPAPARESLGKQVPFPPRLGRPEEYARLVHQIFANPMLNGSVVRLDGAIRMAPR
jgi:NAD(P)-dependent dehydrogenase (short-subunit alcohol dehydrogenase family)